MKTLYTLIFVILLSPALAQVEVIKDELPNYQGVINVPGKDAEELYATLREWVALTYNSANNVIQMDDPFSGKIITKGVYEYFYPQSALGMVVQIVNHLNYSLVIDIKPERLRYTLQINEATTGTGNLENLNSLLLLDSPINPMNGLPYKKKQLPRVYEIKQIHLDKIEAFKDGLVASIYQSTVKASNDDW